MLRQAGRLRDYSDRGFVADDILRQAVQGISDLITIPGEINLDFSDVKTIMSGMGMALMGTDITAGENRTVEAAQRATSSPLLEDATIDGPRSVLINITGGPPMAFYEVAEASSLVHEAAHEEASIIFGAVIDEKIGDAVRVTVIATASASRARARSRERRPSIAAWRCRRPRARRPSPLRPPGRWRRRSCARSQGGDRASARTRGHTGQTPRE